MNKERAETLAEGCLENCDGQWSSLKIYIQRAIEQATQEERAATMQDNIDYLGSLLQEGNRYSPAELVEKLEQRAGIYRANELRNNLN